MFVRSAALKEVMTPRAGLVALGVLSEATVVKVRVDVVEVMDVLDAYMVTCVCACVYVCVCVRVCVHACVSVCV